MNLNKERFSAMLVSAADLWLKNVDQLSDIDSRFGDGDHGITIGKIARLVKECMEGWRANAYEAGIRDTITTLGEKIMGISGGSAGPLYGTFIGGLAVPLTDENEIDGVLLQKMLKGSLDELASITKARVGDKTMMDSIIPAVEAALALGEGASVANILSAANAAAANGALATESIPSKFGRARSYGDKTIGTQDAGAVSAALFFQGLHSGLL
jgi:dihydroxyacetone kinase-like protein